MDSANSTVRRSSMVRPATEIGPHILVHLAFIASYNYCTAKIWAKVRRRQFVHGVKTGHSTQRYQRKLLNPSPRCTRRVHPHPRGLPAVSAGTRHTHTVPVQSSSVKQLARRAN